MTSEEVERRRAGKWKFGFQAFQRRQQLPCDKIPTMWSALLPARTKHTSQWTFLPEAVVKVVTLNYSHQWPHYLVITVEFNQSTWWRQLNSLKLCDLNSQDVKIWQLNIKCFLCCPCLLLCNVVCSSVNLRLANTFCTPTSVSFIDRSSCWEKR